MSLPIMMKLNLTILHLNRKKSFILKKFAFFENIEIIL